MKVSLQVEARKNRRVGSRYWKRLREVPTTTVTRETTGNELALLRRVDSVDHTYFLVAVRKSYIINSSITPITTSIHSPRYTNVRYRSLRYSFFHTTF